MNRFRLKNLLKRLNRQIHVKTLKVHAESPEYLQKNLLSILFCLKPKELVNIEVFGKDDFAPEKVSRGVRKIAMLEQWKLAEKLTIRSCFHYLPSELYMHFKHFVIVTIDFGQDFLINLRDLFSTSTNFESCTIVSYRLEDYPEYLESFCEKVESGEEVIYHYRISDEPNKVLEFKVDYNQDEIVIEKKNF
ncbi:hypothetical protein GCK72_021151 [Caenorhabditis remanei]|uniref:DUF38 domain-containing protein n=1 Tax=Caenorhabditis remanei TaxID=31234 RepID=A0A6A5GHB8_CAERE|nr:hypothetical protein GCK72_021151 [Caenorhabditis remanei]KAF1754588.1 hypothetical protein GCK72_021151 [Caenorhabditis remanei]